MSFWKKLVSYIWTPFNRDSLWNCCLRCNYCTYTPSKVKVGMIFCHVDDDTHKHRAKIGLELSVVKVINNNTFILKIPYLSAVGDNYVSNKENSLFKTYIEVITLKDHSLNPGDVFNVYGQYKLDGYKTIEGKYNCMSLIQINDNGVHVYKEPLVDFGFGDR